MKEVKPKNEGGADMALHLRALTEEETKTIKKWSQSRTEEARLVERAQIVQLASAGRQVPEIAETMAITEKTVRKWLKRFAAQGPVGLEDAPRSGAPSRYTPEVKARIIALALTNPCEVGCKFTCWTLDRLAVYVHEELGFGVKKTRIFEILHEEGLRWRQQETCFGERVDRRVRQTKGAIERLRKEAPAHSAMLDSDEMGPVSAKSHAAA
jgi:transposase